MEEKMSIFLITHGDRFSGANPGHTEEGFRQLRHLAPMIPGDISMFVIGTGKRFREIHETIIENRNDLISVGQKSSPFCGSVDGLDITNGHKIVILFNGTAVDLKEDYISLSAPCFDAWRFINLLPNGALLCAGGELMIALDLKPINEKGQLYELVPLSKIGWKIS